MTEGKQKQVQQGALGREGLQKLDSFPPPYLHTRQRGQLRAVGFGASGLLGTFCVCVCVWDYGHLFIFPWIWKKKITTIIFK